MRYKIEYQYAETGQAPHDEVSPIRIEATDKSGVVILPSVGDYVDISHGESGGYKGKVRSRLFTYVETRDGLWCIVNIVITDTNDDWSKLLRE